MTHDLSLIAAVSVLLLAATSVQAESCPFPSWREARFAQGAGGKAQVAVEPVAGVTLPVLRMTVPARPERPELLEVRLPQRTNLGSGSWTLSVRLRLIAGSGTVGLGLVSADGNRLGWQEVAGDRKWQTIQVPVEVTPGTGDGTALVLRPGANLLTVEVAEVGLVSNGYIAAATAPSPTAAQPTAKAPVNPAAATPPAALPAGRADLPADGGPALTQPPGSGSLLTTLSESRPWAGNTGGSTMLANVKGQPFSSAIRFTFPATATDNTWDAGNWFRSETVLKPGRYTLTLPYRGTDSPVQLLFLLGLRDRSGKEQALTQFSPSVALTWRAWRVAMEVKRELPKEAIALQVQVGKRQGIVEVGEPWLRANSGPHPADYQLITVE